METIRAVLQEMQRCIRTNLTLQHAAHLKYSVFANDSIDIARPHAPKASERRCWRPLFQMHSSDALSVRLRKLYSAMRKIGLMVLPFLESSNAWLMSSNL